MSEPEQQPTQDDVCDPENYVCSDTHLYILSSLFQSYLHAFDPVGLTATHAQKPLLLGDRDCIALHMLHTTPGKGQVSELLLCGLCL